MQKKTLFIIVLIVMIQSCNTEVPKPEEGSALTGSWKFIADQELDSSNRVIREDTNVNGLLVYTTDRKMSVQLLWQGSRASIINDTIMNQDGKSFGLGLGNNTWTLEQSEKIIDTYDAYFGDYTVDWDNDMVTHTIAGNLRPEKKGISYKRKFEIRGDTLYLTSADPAMKWQTKWLKNNE